MRGSWRIGRRFATRGHGLEETSLVVPQLQTRSVYRNEANSERKRLDVAIVGLPNAGKSQLLNCLTGENLAAVSRKRHTTRDCILGSYTAHDRDTQLLFIDTPGFLRTEQAKKEGLSRDLVVSATREMQNVDFTLLVVDAARALTDAVQETIVALMLAALQSKGRLEPEREDHNPDYDRPVIEPKFALVLNKVDLIYPKTDLLDTAVEIGSLAEECIRLHSKAGIDENITTGSAELLVTDRMPMFFYVSALKNDGIDDLTRYMMDLATSCVAWEMENGENTLLSDQERAVEIVREKIYRCLHKEVPHHVQPAARLWRTVLSEDGHNVLIVHQDLIVRSKSHQELVRNALGRIHETAQCDMAKAFHCKVVLDLHVKLAKSTRTREWSI